MKRLTSLFLAFCMMISILPAEIIATENTQPDSGASQPPAGESLWEYSNYADGIQLTAYNGAQTDLYVPAQVDGKTVIRLGDGLFENNDAINSVTLAEGIKEIGEKAFFDADNLVCIVASQTLTVIGAEAFSGCDAFNSVILYDGVTTIGENAFANCPKLTVWCNENTAGYAYAVEHQIPYEILNPNATPETVVENGVTYYLTNGEAVTVDFDGNAAAVAVPAAVNGYPVLQLQGAFQNCEALTQVTLPASLRIIGDNSFTRCYKLAEVNIPAGVTKIGKQAFEFCTALVKVDFPAGLTEIGENAFYACRTLSEVKIPAGVTRIEKETFRECSGLTRLDLPEGLTRIEHSAFRYCSSLLEVVFPESLVWAAAYAFSGCSSLTRAEISANLTYFGSELFSYCTNLSEVILPADLTTVGSSAFAACPALQPLAIPASVTRIDTGAFSANTILLVYENTYAHTYAKNYGLLFFVYDGENEPEIYKLDGVSYYITEGSAVAFYCDSSVTEVTVPAKVNEAPVVALQGTFQNCANLTKVTLPASLQTIGDKAFYGCSNLLSIDIPAGVTTIGARAFYGCEKLAQVEMSEGVTSIGAYAFYDCGKLTRLALPDCLATLGASAFENCRSLIGIAIPEGVSRIESWTFSGCIALAQLEISNSVTYIGEYAFRACYDLTEVTLPGNLATIDDYAFEDCSGLKSLILPEQTQTVGKFVFDGCSALETMVLPAGVTAIGEDAIPANTIAVVYENSYAYRYALEHGLLYFIYDGVHVPQIHILDGVSYYIADGSAVAYQCDPAVTEITIPAAVKGCPVVMLQGAFQNCVQLATVTLPASLQTIGDNSFRNCQSLTSVNMPAGVTRIGASAFEGCYNLRQLELPANLTQLGGSAFRSCWNLYEIAVPKGVTRIEDLTFFDCYGLAGVELPESVTYIGNQAFYHCYALTDITLPVSLTAFGSNVFYDCRSLTQIEIPEKITTLPYETFSRCGSLKSLILPEGLRTIERSAFNGCSALRMTVIPATVTSIATNAFPSGAILLVHENSYAHRFAKKNDLLYFVIHKVENPEIHYGAGIAGVVTYTDGTAAANTAVEILYPDGTLKETVTADENGSYAFTYAEVGAYTIRATDENGNTATTQVSVKRMNAFGVFLSGDTALTLKKSWTVRGAVSDSPATVTLTDLEGNLLASAETEDGAFQLAKIPNGTYVITATTETGSISQEITVFDADLSGITLTIAPAAATIWGYVEVEDRNGALSRRNWVEVTIYNADGLVIAQTRSDEDGKYTFPNLPLGAYALTAETAEMRPDLAHGYDRSHTLTGFAYICAETAATYQAEDIVLREVSEHRADISGKVTAQGDTQDCEVLLQNVFGQEVARYTTGKNGKYTFTNIPDGMYIITATTKHDGMGFAAITVREGEVLGETNISVAKTDKITDREAQFQADLAACLDQASAELLRDRIAEEKRFYDSLSGKEKKQLSKAYVEQLNQLVEWIADCVITSNDPTVSVEQTGLIVSGSELEQEQTVTFTIDVNKVTGHTPSTDGVESEEDFLYHDLQDKAADKQITQYYEITMFKTVDGAEQPITSVQKDTDTTGKFRITMQIPEEYRGHKHYSFLHVHCGEVVELTDLDDDPNTVTFEVDKFSTFALAYTDVELTLPDNGEDLSITTVTLRPNAAGIYFQGQFNIGADLPAARYGIAVSVVNSQPVADDSDKTCLWTQGNTSVLISDILNGSSKDAARGEMPIYARPYVLLEDGTYIYGETVDVTLRSVTETIDSDHYQSLDATQKAELLAMYQQFAPVMEAWTLPNLKTDAGA